MIRLLSLISLTISLSVFSQVPSYYNDVNIKLTGHQLKDALATKIISTHTTVLSYTPEVWVALKEADADPTNNDNVVLIYGWETTNNNTDITDDRTRFKEDHGSGRGVWNREHVYSKSLANPNLGTIGAGADAHNLRPADAQRNSSRNNRKFATGNGSSSYITSEGNWYPGDEWKGDVARMIMYMYLRYGDQTLPTGVCVGNPIATDPNMIDLLLQWNTEDPVSNIEKQRNPVLERMQGNRNPFIDNPNFATQIWGGPIAQNLFKNEININDDLQAITGATTLTISNKTQTSIELTWTPSENSASKATEYHVFKGNSLIGTTNNTNFTTSNLTPETSYYFNVKSFDSKGSTVLISNHVSTITSPYEVNNNSIISDIFISEYLEGNSYNKAIEIANITGYTIDLSTYSLKKVTNGSGTWSNILSLNGTLNDKEVYVIAHGNSSEEIRNKANITNNGVMSFNGNDAIGLFKNDTLIDLLGYTNESVVFSQNEILRRKPYTISPNPFYRIAEWGIFTQEDLSDLGKFSIPLAERTINAISKVQPIVYPNPSSDFIHLNLKGSKNTNFTIINTIGKIVKKGVANEPIEIHDLQAGVYIIKLNNKKHLFVKK
ncbi:endonuclease [Tenacibaculum maritimum]|uniref:endonuclease n=1 Tax=Tenacibaculum maritimum TaxID=107401 RepID=UPI0038770F7A